VARLLPALAAADGTRADLASAERRLTLRSGSGAFTSSAALRDLRDQIALNQALLGIGLAAADQFVRAVAEAGGAALFAGAA